VTLICENVFYTFYRGVVDLIGNKGWAFRVQDAGWARKSTITGLLSCICVYAALKIASPDLAQQFGYLELKGEESTRSCDISQTTDVLVCEDS
jgi:hypothetical protein